MIVQLIRQGGLDREGLVDELLVEFFLDVLDEDNGLALHIKLGAASAAHHLEYIGDRVVYVSLGLGIEELGSFNDNQVSWEVDTPR